MEENIVTFINNLEAENQDIECKQCKRILPKDLWSTYSAFANTHGGKIILGITEIKNMIGGLPGKAFAPMVSAPVPSSNVNAVIYLQFWNAP